jgi:hypothetical protein
MTAARQFMALRHSSSVRLFDYCMVAVLEFELLTFPVKRTACPRALRVAGPWDRSAVLGCAGGDGAGDYGGQVAAAAVGVALEGGTGAPAQGSS